MTKLSKLLIIFASAFVGSQTMASQSSVWDVISVIEIAQGKNPSATQTTGVKPPAITVVTPSAAVVVAPVITISAASLANQSLSAATTALSTAKITLNQSSPALLSFAPLSTAGNYPPSSMGIAFGGTAEYLFFNGTQSSVDLSALVATADWSKGITFVMLGVDQSGNVMSSLSPSIASFSMFMYDGTGAYLGSIPVPISTRLTGFGYSVANDPWSQTSQSLTLSLGALKSAATYPAMFTITGPSPIQIFPGASHGGLSTATSYTVYNGIAGSTTGAPLRASTIQSIEVEVYDNTGNSFIPFIFDTHIISKIPASVLKGGVYVSVNITQVAGQYTLSVVLTDVTGGTIYGIGSIPLVSPSNYAFTQYTVYLNNNQSGVSPIQTSSISISSLQRVMIEQKAPLVIASGVVQVLPGAVQNGQLATTTTYATMNNLTAPSYQTVQASNAINVYLYDASGIPYVLFTVNNSVIPNISTLLTAGVYVSVNITNTSKTDIPAWVLSVVLSDVTGNTIYAVGSINLVAPTNYDISQYYVGSDIIGQKGPFIFSEGNQRVKVSQSGS